MTTQIAKTPIWLPFSAQDGYIHHWLVAGPVARPVTNLDDFPGADFKVQIARAGYQADSGVLTPPVERGTFVPFEQSQEITWHLTTCLDDHFVDLSRFHHTCHHLHAWAYTALDAASPGPVALTLTVNGPADVWVNGAHVHRVAEFHHQLPHSSAFSAPLQAGRNEILVRFEGVAVRECPYVMALQAVKAGEELTVALPTTVEPADYRQRLETIFAQAYLDRDVLARQDELVVHWPEGKPLSEDITLRVQRKDGRIYTEQQTQGRRMQHTQLGVAYQFPEDQYQVVLMPPVEAYYVHDVRVERRLDFQITGNEYSVERYGSYPDRRTEALQDAAKRRVNLFSEIAKMELGQWTKVDTAVIQETLAMVNSRADCSDFYLVGLLGMAGRYSQEEGFPQDLLDPLQTCFLNFRYWMDEPGSDAMCFWSENHQILFHTCEILAGQLLPDEHFSNAGLTGAEHQSKGEGMALTWLRKRAAGGFREWDSNTYFEEDVLALSHLADLAENDDVRELAAVVLDKLLLSLAVNSFNGVFGSTHGRTYTPYIKGAYREPTAGLSRLLWGKGIFNDRILGTVSLACAAGYQLPPVIEAIALDPAQEIWSRERHAGKLEQWCDLAEGAWEVNKVTYKTPDSMLASAQDYLPGQAGYQQHIWQATFSPSAMVFVTHPPCVSEEGSHRPNFWHGNVTLPRVAQWKDVLVDVRQLGEGDWLGFTHAYFPIYAFDEYAIQGGWAFARAGKGYLAITAARGLELVKSGKNAFRELRSHGRQNVWLVQMGREAQDGGFGEFKQKVLGLDVTFGDLTAHAETLRGESIDFGWTGPLLVNEVEEPLSNFRHMENVYSNTELDADQMEIQFQDLLVRLDFS